jgi:hypothetical protein
MTSTIQVKAALVANCGLYCGACRSYLSGKCKGCRENAKATWCKVRSCCIEKQIQSCAGCAEFSDPQACKKFNNVISKIFGLIFKSNRAACIAQIKKLGLEGHARAMTDLRYQTIKR